MSTVLVIAGSDSSGGAGIARDIRTLAQLGVGACCALTAVTAQTNQAVLASHALPPKLVRLQIEAAFAGGSVGAVKIGMLATGAIVRVVAAALTAHPQVPVVLDPVLESSSGAALLDAAGHAALVTRLLPRVTLLTPNIPEAAALLGTSPAQAEHEIRAQAQALLALGPRAVLIKGGHARADAAVDLLVLRDGHSERFSASRAAGMRRGSGCALSAAIAAALARGLDLPAACSEAKEYVTGLFSSAD